MIIDKHANDDRQNFPICIWNSWTLLLWNKPNFSTYYTTGAGMSVIECEQVPTFFKMLMIFLLYFLGHKYPC